MYGPADGSAPMSGDAGSYRVARDTATGNVAYCWGTNTSGELGDGTTDPRHTPVAVAAPAP